MAKIINIKTEKDKRELTSLLLQIENIDDSQIDNSSLEQFEEKRDRYKNEFIKKHDLPCNDERILYEICDTVKKSYKKPFSEEICMLLSTASNIIISLTSSENRCVENDFYNKIRKNWNNNSEKENYLNLRKSIKTWMKEIQKAINTRDFNLLLNSMSLMSFFASKSFKYK